MLAAPAPSAWAGAGTAAGASAAGALALELESSPAALPTGSCVSAVSSRRCFFFSMPPSSLSPLFCAPGKVVGASGCCSSFLFF